MMQNKKLLALVITIILVTSFSFTAFAGNNSEGNFNPVFKDHPGQGVAKNQEKKSEQVKKDKNITNFTVMNGNKLKVKNKNVKWEVPPVIKEGRILIPVRAVTQGLGAEVDWDGVNKIVTISKGGITIEFYLDSGEVFVNGQAAEIDVTPGFINNSVFVPLRFIAEVLGEKVKYDPDTGGVNIGDEAGAIGGKVTLKDTGAAIKDIQVRVFDGSNAVARTRTDSNGEYRLNDVPVGTYTLEFSHQDYITVERRDVKVNEDTLTRVNVIMTIREQAAGSISGKVTAGEADGAVIASVQVRVYNGEDLIARTSTNRNGQYTLSNLAIGTYRIEFSHDDYVTVSKRVMVSNGEITVVNAIMTKKVVAVGSASGKVTAGEADGAVIDSVQVRVYNGDDLVARTSTNRNGQYTLSNLAVGTYRIEFSHDDYVTVSKRVLVNNGETTVVNAVMIKKVVAVGSASGKVTAGEAGGTVIGSVQVRVYNGDDLVARTSTNRSGQYTLSNLAVGTYRIEFSHDDYVTVSKRVSVKESETTVVNVVMTEKEKTVVSVTGYIFNSSSGNAIENVQVVISGTDYIGITRTDNNGKYNFTDVPAGTYELQFKNSEAIVYETTVTIEEGRTVTVTIRISL